MQGNAASPRKVATLDVTAALSAALGLILGLDPGFLAIVRLSLGVTLAAVAIAALIGLPLGALLALSRFPGRGVVIVLVNAMMGLPPVVAGLVVFLLLSRSGPLGALGLLFTPAAMIVAQALLVLPIHLFGDRALFGNFAKSFTVSFEPVPHPAVQGPLRDFATVPWHEAAVR